MLALKAKGVGAHFGALVAQIEMEKGAAARRLSFREPKKNGPAGEALLGRS
jgi:hypothetical protein